MSEVVESLVALPKNVIPTLALLGGERLVLDDRELVSDSSVSLIVDLLCESWASLEDPTRAAEFIIEAAEVDDAFVFADVLEIVLSSESALPMVAPGLVNVLRELTKTNTIRAEIAIESWTRLAFGKWCATLEIRSRLSELAARAVDSKIEPSPYLVRALGAALDVWGDQELESGMQALLETDAAEDIAVELGMHSIVVASEAETIDAARGHLQKAAEWFRVGLSYDSRADAEVFLMVVELVDRFAGGRRITEQDVEELREAVSAYLTGYWREVPHWRQPRAESSQRWLVLIADLARAAELESPPMIEVGAILESATRVYGAHRTLALVENPGQIGESTPRRGIAALVQPRIEAGFAGAGDAIRQLEKWAALQGDRIDPDLVLAIEELRMRLTTEVANPKASGGSRPSLSQRTQDMLRLSPLQAEVIEEALQLHPNLQTALEEVADRVSGLSAAQEALLYRTLEEITGVVGDLGSDKHEIIAMLTVLIKFVATHLDLQQSGSRKPAWLGEDGKKVKEEKFADELCSWLIQSGIPAFVETPNVGGGRGDIIIPRRRGRTVIEVKRVLAKRTDEKLLDDYGTQATQYQATDAPIAFLAVLDYSPRSHRTDLDTSFITRRFDLKGSERAYSLTLIRVQANVQPPSATSR